jgi:hypothetical protein
MSSWGATDPQVYLLYAWLVRKRLRRSSCLYGKDSSSCPVIQDMENNNMNEIEITPVPSIADQLKSVTDQVTLAAQQVTPAPVRGKTIDQEGVVRGLRDEAGAIAAGFAPEKPIYALGTMVVTEGVRRFRESRRAFESLPLAVEACEALIETIKAEDRLDKVMDLPNLRANDDGTLYHSGNGTYVPSERALTGLCGFATPGGAGYLINCPNDLRAQNLNYWLPKALREDKVATRQALKAGEISEEENLQVPIQVKMRTRKIADSTNREAYAIVGPEYGDHNLDEIAAQVIKHVPGGARAKVTYDGFRGRIDVAFHSDIQPTKVVAGEIFQAGIRIATADDGTGSIKVTGTATRNLCLNLMILHKMKQDISRRSHRGTSEAIASDVEAGIQTAMAKMAYFADAWDNATMENVLEKFSLVHTEDSVKKLFQALTYSKLVYVAGNNYKVMAEKMFQAWTKEPGYNRTAFVNAVTRAAHESTWSTPWVSDEVENQGSALLFKKDWKLTFAPEEETDQVVLVNV